MSTWLTGFIDSAVACRQRQCINSLACMGCDSLSVFAPDMQSTDIIVFQATPPRNSSAWTAISV
ncbi:hypothetical protein BDN67DRAFT_963410, partial [Paxillus ammoniavirescens]